MRTYDIVNAGPRNRFMANGKIVSNSGRGIQLQNLYRNSIHTLDEARELIKAGDIKALRLLYGDVTDVLAQAIRTMLVAKPRCEFIVADYSAIECRVLAWEAGEQWTLDAFRRGEDIYCSTASQMFGVPVGKHGPNAELRQKGKVASLACGYQGGAGALISMGALDMGLHESELPDIIDGWRNANPHIVQYWRDLEDGCIQTVNDHKERQVQKIIVRYYAGTLWLTLPSGRSLAFLKPRILPNRFGRMSLTYEGSGGTESGGKWTRISTYGGRIAENLTQAIARDLLVDAMLRMEKAGLEIVAHVHDEVIIESPVGEHSLEEICDIMAQSPPWAPDLPLAAAGYSGAKFYYKD